MNRTIGKTLLLSSFFALSATACLQQDERPAGLEQALPTAEQLSIKLPEGQTRAVGQLAEYYTHTRNITRSVQRPTTVNLITGGGSVCFNNHGNLGRQTSHLTLHLDDPRTEWPAQRRVEFNWNLVGAAPPPGSKKVAQK